MLRSRKIYGILTLLLIIGMMFSFSSLALASEDMPAELLQKVKEEGNKLNILNWSYYIAEDTIPNFEKEFGVKVTYDTFESADAMVAKLQAGGSGYDVVVADNEYVQYLKNLKLLQPLNHKWLHNIVNLMDKFVNPSYDPNNKFAVAYLWGSAGFVFNEKYIKDDPRVNGDCSWAILFEGDEYAGRIGMLDSSGVSMSAALLYLGYSINTHDKDQLTKAKEVLLKQKSKVRAYGQVRKLLEAEETYLATLWSGDSVAVKKNIPSIKYCAPKEGMQIYVDNLVISKKAEHPATAHLFINYCLRGKVAANNANYVHYATTNKAALPFIDKTDRKDPAVYPPDEVLEKCQFQEAFSGEELKFREQIWEEVKAK